MRLDPMVRDYNSFVTELADVLRNASTRIYLDTSVLLWLTRLGDAARDEVIRWCNARNDNLKVPVWAAHEFHKHALAGTVRANLGKMLGETRAAFDGFRRLAAERADESICLANGFAGRVNYISELEATSIRFQNLSKIIEGDDGRIQRNTQDVIEFINAHVLTTDIEPIIERLSLTGQFRFDHLVPPGFQDKKEFNRFGDVIIWEELIRDLGKIDEKNAISVVLVSRDKKTDWVTSAALVKTNRGDEKINRDFDLDVPLSHPLLAHEFKVRTGGDKLYIAHPQFVASVLDYSSRSRGEASEVGAWLAASHRADHLSLLAVDTRMAISAPKLVAQPLAATTAKALMGISVSSELRSLSAALPGDNQLLKAAVESVVDHTAAYKFGRLLSEGVAAGDVVIVGQTLALFELLIQVAGGDLANAAFLSFATAAYFDQYGDPRIVPIKTLAPPIFSLESDSRFASAVSALRALLEGADINLPHIPGTDTALKFQIDLSAGKDGRLRDIRIGEQSALVERPAGDARRLSSLLDRAPDSGCSGKELRALVARELLIPAQRLNAQFDSKRLTWAANAGLAELDTTAEGGLSAFDDEEREGA
jgi:hypothetical protein